MQGAADGTLQNFVFPDTSYTWQQPSQIGPFNFSAIAKHLVLELLPNCDVLLNLIIYCTYLLDMLSTSVLHDISLTHIVMAQLTFFSYFNSIFARWVGYNVVAFMFLKYVRLKLLQTIRVFQLLFQYLQKQFIIHIDYRVLRT